MKQYTLGIKVLIAVEVPEDADEFTIEEILTPFVLYWIIEKNGTIDLPPGSYSILARGRDIIDSQWQDLLEEEMNLDIQENEWWRNYEDDYKPFRSATESGLSWLRSHGINENDLLILKLK